MSDKGSALVLVLLVTALLTTITVSFLSTARVEQMATRNFTRQNAAAGMAQMATQQAMAKIKHGFTVASGGSGTTLITTQPGAIRQFTFSSGNCTPVAAKNPVELFTTTGSIDANLNNLQNPSSNSPATSDQWTITGNASEQINVPMEEIEDSAGNLIGRIAYYVDDEGTKLNLNSATGNRDTLNAALRPLDIAALVPSAANTFEQIVNGTSPDANNSSDIRTWSHFFRPEQAAAAVSGISGNHTPFLSTAGSANDVAHLLTPWGDERIHINTLSTNATDGSGDDSVLAIHSALTDPAITDIFGSDFADKYTSTGVKQIAANILQMRDPYTNSVNASFSYNGSLLGSNGTNIPNEYLGYAPSPVITEVGVSVLVGGLYYYAWGYLLNLYFCPTIEISNPYPSAFNGTTSGARLIFGKRVNLRVAPYFLIDEVSFDIDHGSGITQRYTWSLSNTTHTTLRSPLNNRIGPANFGPEQSGDPFSLPDIPAFSKIQYQPDWVHWFSCGLPIVMPTAPRINSISNCTVKISEVTLSVGGNIRDWVSGNETGPIDCRVTPMQAFPWNASNWPGTPGFPIQVSPRDNPIGNLPDTSTQRIDWIRKSPTNATINLTSDDDRRNWTTTNSTGRGGGVSGNPSTGFPPGNWTESQSSWINTNSTVSFLQANYTTPSSGPEMYNSTKALPSISKNATIPSDPSYEDRPSNAVYGNATHDMREPFLVTGNYTCPADLGFVPTNQRWRRLRMQMQPALEGWLIPDWAMLDVISFGDSDPSSAMNRAVPVNINGRFHLPGNATVAPRTIGVQALAEVIQSSTADNIQDTMNPASTPIPTDPTRFRGNMANATTIASAIGNMTWSGNSTWGQGNFTSDPGSRRKSSNFPVDLYILPSEIMEIAGVADAVDQTDYNNSTSHFKWNEGRASALLPAVTTRSSFFTIYAYAQALDKLGNIDSEAVTKTLVEVEVETPATPTTPATYNVKKLYTQRIVMGE